MENQPFSNIHTNDSEMLLAPLTSMMKVELVVNEAGSVWILHDKPFTGILHWIEFDAVFQSITMVMRDGTSHDLGITVNEEIASVLDDGVMIFTILTDKDKIKDMYMIPLIVRD